MDSLCSESAQISLTSLVGGEQLTIDRDKFNANSIEIGEDISELPNLFMYKCSDFTGTVTFNNNNPQLRDIGESFMSGCSKFNSKLVLPSSIRTILSGFMFGCSSFNSPLDLGPVKIIGQDFMGLCSSFAQKLIISDQVEYLAVAFMWECRNFTQLEINCPPHALNSDDNSTLIVTTQDCPAYKGVYISGTCKSTFVGQFGPISTDSS
ncbi:MAG: hypothetical protein MJ200_02095 [Mycoplasmoidaceae bacterium]|nr:hypothetical protein [Mycoplasmoidaceae bacterium]